MKSILISQSRSIILHKFHVISRIKIIKMNKISIFIKYLYLNLSKMLTIDLHRSSVSLISTICRNGETTPTPKYQFNVQWKEERILRSARWTRCMEGSMGHLESPYFVARLICQPRWASWNDAINLHEPDGCPLSRRSWRDFGVDANISARRDSRIVRHVVY